MGTAKAVAKAIGAACLAGSLSIAQPSQAAEYGWGTYLLGLSLPMAGYTPPPGLYFQDTVFSYHGSAGGNVQFPFGGVLAAGIHESFLSNISTFSWFLDASILGGTLGVAVTGAFGRETTTADLAFTGPLGNMRQLSRSDTASGQGDSAVSALLGWHQGENHWNITATGIFPTGVYSPTQIAFMGLNRPGVDLKGAYTYLSMTTGLEVSGALGMTFNAINQATQYQTGNEAHFEWAINEHFANGFSLGVGGYLYQQVTDDGGAGDRVGPFRGRVVSIGPLAGYTFKAGEIPVTLGARWYYEFDVENRVAGNSGMLTLSMPLAGPPPPAVTTKY